MKGWREFVGSRRAGEDGFILPLVLVFLALGVLLLTPTLGHGFTSLEANRETNFRSQELHAADSGLEEGIYWLLHLRPGDEYEWNDSIVSYERVAPYELNDMDVYVTIEPLTGEDDQNTYKITSLAQRPGGTSSTVLAKAYVLPIIVMEEGEDPYEIDEYFFGDLAVDGDLELQTANAEVEGDVFVTGNLDLGQGSLIVGDVLADGDVELGQSANIHCNVLCTGGNLTLGQSADVDPKLLDSEIHFIGWESPDPPFELYLGQLATITGDIYADGPLKIIMTNPQVYMSGDIVVDGDLTIDIDTPSGDITGNLYCTGDVMITLGKDTNGIYDPDLGAPHEATLYYDDANKDYTIDLDEGDPDATYPTGEGLCANWPDNDCVLPEPEKDCPVFPDPTGDVLSWEIS